MSMFLRVVYKCEEFSLLSNFLLVISLDDSSESTVSFAQQPACRDWFRTRDMVTEQLKFAELVPCCGHLELVDICSLDSAHQD